MAIPPESHAGLDSSLLGPPLPTDHLAGLALRGPLLARIVNDERDVPRQGPGRGGNLPYRPARARMHSPRPCRRPSAEECQTIVEAAVWRWFVHTHHADYGRGQWLQSVP